MSEYSSALTSVYVLLEWLGRPRTSQVSSPTPGFALRCLVLQGLENLPRDRPTVLALNHQSFLDAFLLAGVSNINFKVSFKRSLLFYPGRAAGFPFLPFSSQRCPWAVLLHCASQALANCSGCLATCRCSAGTGPAVRSYWKTVWCVILRYPAVSCVILRTLVLTPSSSSSSSSTSPTVFYYAVIH